MHSVDLLAVAVSVTLWSVASAAGRPRYLPVTFTKFQQHFSRADCPQLHLQRLYTRRASSFYAFIYAPFIIFKVRLFLARRRATVIYFLPPGLPETVCCCVPRFIFIFLLLIMELLFYFFTLLLGACVFVFYFCVKRRAVGVVVFFSLIEPHTELWSLKDNLYYGNLGCV